VLFALNPGPLVHRLLSIFGELDGLRIVTSLLVRYAFNMCDNNYATSIRQFMKIAHAFDTDENIHARVPSVIFLHSPTVVGTFGLRFCIVALEEATTFSLCAFKYFCE